MEMDLMEYLVSQALVLVPALWVIGAMIKRIPRAPHWVIPFVLLVLGIVGAGLILGFSVESVLQGIIAAGVAVFGHQLVKQAAEASSQTVVIKANKNRN
ncbi:phage holin family protein [Gehongia tenuis]|nr:phage holin family protein [Gehongia tenuis]